MSGRVYVGIKGGGGGDVRGGKCVGRVFPVVVASVILYEVGRELSW